VHAFSVKMKRAGSWLPAIFVSWYQSKFTAGLNSTQLLKIKNTEASESRRTVMCNVYDEDT